MEEAMARCFFYWKRGHRHVLRLRKLADSLVEGLKVPIVYVPHHKYKGIVQKTSHSDILEG